MQSSIINIDHVVGNNSTKHGILEWTCKKQKNKADETTVRILWVPLIHGTRANQALLTQKSNITASLCRLIKLY